MSLRNIENTTLENWPDSSATEPPSKPSYHFAIKQSDVNLEFHLERFFRSEETSFHFFDSFEDLSDLCQRHTIDAILIAGKSSFSEELNLVRSIKQNVILAIVPVILYHPDPSGHTLVAAYENGAEDFIYGEWVERLSAS